MDSGACGLVRQGIAPHCPRFGALLLAWAAYAAALPARGALVDETAGRLPADSGGLYAAAAADVDGDGDADLVLATRSGLRLLLNQGPGLFSEAPAGRLPPLAGAFLGVAAGDIDGDGDADLFAASPEGRSRLLVNTGGGVYADQTAARVPASAAIAAGALFLDADRDGDADLAVACRDGADRLLRNNGAGVFAEAPAGDLPGDAGATSGVAAGDFDGDGWPDLILTREDGPPRLLLNTGFAAFVDASAGGLPAGLPGTLGAAVADVDGDGDLDVLLAGGETGLQLLLNDGAAHFARAPLTAVPLPAHHAAAATLADFDEDGLPDAAAACAGQDRFLRNLGGGLFADETAAQLPADTERTFGVLAVDVDGDLDLDLVLARPGHQTRLLINAIAFPRVRVTVQPGLVEVGQTVAIHVDAFDEDGIATLDATVNGAPLPLAGGNGTWSPAAPGVYTVAVVATDTQANVGARQAVFTAVANVAPVVRAGPDAAALRGQPFVGAGAFSDPGDDVWTGTVDYGDGTGVQPLALAPDKTFQLNHVYNAFGVFTVTVTVNDGDDTGVDTLTVTVANRPPVVSAIPPQVAQAPLSFAPIPLDEYVADPDHADAELVWTATGATVLTVAIGPGRVAVIGYPEGATVAETITFTATDPEGAAASVSALFSVVAFTGDALRPVVTLGAAPPDTTAGTPVVLTVTIADESPILTRSLTVNGGPVELQAAGPGRFTGTFLPASPGVYTAEARAMDNAGNEGYAALEFRALVPGDVTPPAVAIVTPADGDEVAAPLDVFGTAADANLTRYTLACSLKGRDDFRVFATGTAPVTDGVLGRLDTTLMENGIYDLRLAAEDRSGNTAECQVTIQVAAALKVGEVSLAFQDMKVSVAGIPIALCRRYDSRDKGKGDFGYGWRLDVNSVRLTVSGVLGESWEHVRSGGFIPTYSLQPTGPHYVMVDYPDGSWEAFSMRLDPSSSVLYPLAGIDVAVSYQAYAGTYSTLTALGPNIVWNLLADQGPTELVYADTLDTYRPARFRLTTPEGAQLVLAANGGVESITDLNGNVTTFTPTGITHSSGRGLRMERDDEGRITRVTDPNGNSVVYEYDAYGDLVAVTNQLGETTRFIYDRDHNLTDMITSDGVRGIRNQYDAAGRLASTANAEGQRITFTRDLTGRTETITDQEGNVTTVRYDLAGNVTSVTDPLGHTRTFTYDGSGNLTTGTDALGHVLRYVRDAQGNVTQIVAPDGSTTVTTYDARNNLTSITDALGRTTSVTYDGRGNLLTITSPLGSTTTYTYDAQGRQTSVTDALGRTYSFAYNAQGDLATVTDPLGVQTSFTYDANGNLLSKSRQRTLPGGTVVETAERYEYDGLNRRTAVVDPEGRRTEIGYAPTGDIGSVAVPGGRTYRIEYDRRGFSRGIRFPDGTGQEYAFDGRGLMTSRTGRHGGTETFEYDAAGRPLRNISPGGVAVTLQHDAANRLAAITNALGETTAFTQDANSRLTAMTDALGRATAFSYNANSWLTGATDPEGRVTQAAYDADGRVSSVTAADGQTVAYGYDAANRRTSVTDPLGNTARYEYDPVGRLTKVIDPLGGETVYAYDEVGNLVSAADALGRVSRYEYNGAGQTTRRTCPLGAAETWTYDEAGLPAAYQDANGGVTRYEYDAGGRLARILYPDGSATEFTYTAGGALETCTDAGGTSRYAYDADGRLVRRTDPLGQVITYTYDAAGRPATVTAAGRTTTYTYDAAGQLARVEDADGQVWTFTCTPAGREAVVLLPNGTRTEISYDPCGRVTQTVHRSPADAVLRSFAYTYDAAGRCSRVVEDSGRQVDYTYDALGRLTAETITDPVRGNRLISYTYDAVGNRLSRTDNGAVTVYTYDARDRLLSAGPVSYGYDEKGRLTSRTEPTRSWTYEYNGRNQLVRAVRNEGGALTTIEFVYHLDLRIRTLVNGVEADRALHDTNRVYSEVAAELGPDGLPRAANVFGHRLLGRTAAGRKLYYHRDGRPGSIVLLTDETGAAVASYTYDAFGRELVAEGTGQSPYRFAGERLDSLLGLYDLRARLYDPETGRFLTPDPLPGTLTYPPSRHPYSYAANDPLNSRDPTGTNTLSELACTAAVIAILAGIHTGLVFTDYHPLLIGTGRRETKHELLPDGRYGEPGFSGHWIRMSSTIDIGVASLSVSPKFTVSRAIGIDVGMKHIGFSYQLNLLASEPVAAKVVEGIFFGKSAIMNAMAASLASSSPNSPAALPPLGEAFLDAVQSAIWYTGAAMGAAPILVQPVGISIGAGIGLSAGHNAPDSGQLAGWSFGLAGGASYGEGLVGVGFDVGLSIGFNMPPDERGVVFHGMWEFPSFSIFSSLGLRTSMSGSMGGPKAAVVIERSWEYTR